MKKILRAVLVMFVVMAALGTTSIFAADKVRLTATTKTLYVGGSQGVTASGKVCATGASKNLKNMVTINGRAFDTSKYKLEISPQEEGIVTVKGNTITAVKMGTVNVDIKALDKKTGEQVDNTLTLKVTVKKNADEIKLKGLSAGDKVTTGDLYTVYCPNKKDGELLDTDKRGIQIVAADGTETGFVIKKLPAANYWTVIFNNPGTYTVAVYNYQSSSYPGAILTDSVTVTAEAAPVATPTPKPVPEATPTPTPLPYYQQIGYTGISQTGLNSLSLDFSSSPRYLGVKAEDLEIYCMNESKHDYSIVPLKYTPSVSGNKVIVTLQENFERGKEYFVKFADVVYSFLAVTNTAQDISNVVIEDALIIARDSVNEYTPDNVNTMVKLKYSCYNAIGMKINEEPIGGVSWEVVSANTSTSGSEFFEGYNGLVSLAEPGDNIEIILSFNAYDFNGSGHKEYSLSRVFTAVPYEVFTGVTKMVVGNSPSLSFQTASTNAIKENGLNPSGYFEYFMEYRVAGQTRPVYIKGSDRGYTYETEDQSIAWVQDKNTLCGFKAGETMVLVKNPNGEVINACPLMVVKPAKKCTIEFIGDSLNVNPSANEKIVVNIQVFNEDDVPYTFSRVGFAIAGSSPNGSYTVRSNTYYTDQTTGILTYTVSGTNLLTVGTSTSLTMTIDCVTDFLENGARVIKTFKVYNEEVK